MPGGTIKKIVKKGTDLPTASMSICSNITRWFDSARRSPNTLDISCIQSRTIPFGACTLWCFTNRIPCIATVMSHASSIEAGVGKVGASRFMTKKARVHAYVHNANAQRMLFLGGSLFKKSKPQRGYSSSIRHGDGGYSPG